MLKVSVFVLVDDFIGGGNPTFVIMENLFDYGAKEVLYAHLFVRHWFMDASFIVSLLQKVIWKLINPPDDWRDQRVDEN